MARSPARTRLRVPLATTCAMGMSASGSGTGGTEAAQLEKAPAFPP